jgi:DNA replication initiation complex subunit (GINS family)
MAEDIITYETLYELLRNEKYKEELQILDKDFFLNVINYLKDKRTILESQENKSSIFSSIEIQKTRKQLDNIQKILKELYERRENKLIQLALFSSRTKETPDTSILSLEEKQYFEEITHLLNKYRNDILFNLLNEKLPQITNKEELEIKGKTQEETAKEIKFNDHIPKFLGEDLKEYGPFEKDMTAKIPIKVAKILINKEKAIEIK